MPMALRPGRQRCAMCMSAYYTMGYSYVSVRYMRKIVIFCCEIFEGNMLAMMTNLIYIVDGWMVSDVKDCLCIHSWN